MTILALVAAGWAEAGASTLWGAAQAVWRTLRGAGERRPAQKHSPRVYGRGAALDAPSLAFSLGLPAPAGGGGGQSPPHACTPGRDGHVRGFFGMIVGMFKLMGILAIAAVVLYIASVFAAVHGVH